MITPLTGTAIAFDFVGTMLVLYDQIRSRKDADRLNSLSMHITQLRAIVDGFMNIKPLPGAKIPGTNAGIDEVTQISIEAGRMALQTNTKMLLDLQKEIDDANRVPLGYIATFILAIGIILHAVEAFVSHGG